MRLLLIILFSALTVFGQYGGSGYGQYGNRQTASGYLSVTNYEPESRAYFASLTTPLSSAQKKKINLLVRQLKDSLGVTSLSSAFDVFYIFANETQEAGLKNLVKRSHDATAVNTPTFTQYEGFTGDTVSMYINTNYNPNSSKIAYAVTNASIATYNRKSTVTSNKVPIGAFNTGGSQEIVSFRANTAGGLNISSLNYTGGATPSYTSTGADGLYIMSRTASNLTKTYRNNVEVLSSAESSQGIPNFNIFILARNNSNTPALFSDQQISISFIGRGLSASEVSKINNIIEYYMDSLGKGVQ